MANKDDAVNWGDPPLHKGICKEDAYKPERWSGYSAGRESEELIVPKNSRTT